MGKWNQLTLLLWKNFLIQKRKIFLTIFEIGLPTFFGLILLLIRFRVKTEAILHGVNWTDCSEFKVLPFTSKIPRQLAYTPMNHVTNQIMNRTKNMLSLTDVQGFNTEEEMVDFLIFANSTVNNTKTYLGGVVFQTNLLDTKHIQYSIRLSSYPRNTKNKNQKLNPIKDDTNWFTQYMFPLYQRIGPRSNISCGGDPGYVREGFTALQTAISQSVISIIANETGSQTRLKQIELGLHRHPYPPYNDDKYVLVIQQQFPLILILSFVLVALNIVKDIVHEKERKLKESMKMMGLSNWLHWMAWFIKYTVFLFITVLIMTILLAVKTDKGAVINKSNPVIIFIFLMLYAISTISFCCTVSVFFSKANSGAAAGGILFFLTYIPYLFLQPRYADLSLTTKLTSSLISNVAMSYGGQVIGMFEGTGAGVQWNTLTQGASVDDNFSLAYIMMMMVVDTVLYGIITWYIEAVFPGEYGVPLPWYFPFTSSYWFGTVASDEMEGDENYLNTRSSEYFEQDPTRLRPGIQIRNLKKVFKTNGTMKTAVEGMTLNIYEGQITALLGHNGAGKTTTISMLTGFFPPSSGTAKVNGYDIRKDITSVRSSLGLCPQHDILFDSLTVEEHLQFFACLKGCPKDKVKNEVDSMISQINLKNKSSAASKTLSGGMKRKLSVGIALIAGSKIVILDEPSSGLDPDARRQIWTVLQKNKEGRTMILTTHFMDEADLLGDRIAIMADGDIKCYGTSLFLKNKYGAGYHMVIVKDVTCDVNRVTEVIKSYVPSAEMENNVGAELSYILPHESSHKFEEMFTDIEENKTAYGIASYGASVTTMEEVFLRVGENRSIELPQHNGAVGTKNNVRMDLSVNATEVTSGMKKNKGTALFLQQFYAMFIKRAKHTMRNKIVTITQLAIPLFYTIMALTVVRTFPGPGDSPPLKLNVSAYGRNTIVYNERGGQGVNLMGHFFEMQFEKSPDDVVNVKRDSQFNNIDDYLFQQGIDGLGYYNLHYIVGAKFVNSNVTNKIKATAYFNDQSFHSSAISLATMFNSVIKFVMNGTGYSLSTVNSPLPRTQTQKIRDETKGSTTGFTISFNFVFGISFLSSSFVLFLIKERATKAKHIQFVSGVSPINFWLSTFCWDMINYIIPCIFLIITFVAFNITAYLDPVSHVGHMALLLILYGWAMLPFMYLLSFIFTVPSTGFVWLTMFNILSGDATILAVGILGIPQLDLEDLAKALEWVFLTFLPNFCLGQGLMDYYMNYEYLEVCKPIIGLCKAFPNPCCKDVNIGDDKCGPEGCFPLSSNYLGWEKNGIGRMLVFLAVQGVAYFSLLLFLESRYLNRFQYAVGQRKERTYSQLSDDSEVINEHTPLLGPNRNVSIVQEDTDVATERARLANASLSELFNTDSLIMKELTKYYDNNLAVDHTAVGIPEGECFGLLGVNGAGKTTTFKILTGDEVMSSGHAYLDGISVTENITEVRQRLGYCPQYDALIDQMTGRETLYMFARLRGVHETVIPEVVDGLITSLLLKKHADKLVKAYSGGNKRKLSTAIALVGNPPIVFLDEPTTGMDPVARRHLWDVLSNIRDSGRTLVLTSHSMEECEALCTRLAIMVNGQFKCLGSPQHLKNKFGEGYSLLARIGTPPDGTEPDIQPLMRFIKDKFPNSEIKDIHQEMIHYHVKDTKLTWAKIFGLMEQAKIEYNIEDYSVSQTTLEQVFINFARSQIPPIETKVGCFQKCSFVCGLCCCNNS
ncbi:phospholipid-transporting ATPase ABCA3-like isoform X2 [Mytilus edulis]|uniref:phospholipid-transporting ATPase ABCA3-like isoform X2 n=1 Tax=Mytilus edulis TaxID=6550 RepID=UPI0039EF8CD7